MYVLQVSGRSYAGVAGGYRDPEKAKAAVSGAMDVLEEKYFAKCRTYADPSDIVGRSDDVLATAELLKRPRMVSR